MEIDPASLTRRDAYQLLISCVVPRPIAWLSTLSSDGVPNLAPFSFFGGVTAAPPTVMVSIGRRRGGHKDSAANLLESGEGVVHIAHRPLAESMVKTSAEVEADINEFELAGLVTASSRRVAPHRVRDAAIAMETVVSRHLEIGDGPTDLFLLEIVHFHVDDTFVVEGLPDPARLAAVGRLGGNGYCDTEAPFFVARPE
jgi:flavin reductase (DIM6/NTAB) family NADH-FMN oxidoreductase RutF